MKKVKSKTILFIVISVFIFSSLIFTMQCSNEIEISNKNFSEVADICTLMQKEISENSVNTISVISNIENELNEKGTSILETLYNLKNFYINELDKISNENKNLILSTISILDEAIVSFEQRYSNNYENNDLRIAKNNQFKISPNCTCTDVEIELGNPCASCVEYKQTFDAVAAIGTGFSARGWNLAADLIFHNLDNKEYDSDYWPSLGRTIKEAPQMVKIANNSLLTESSGQSSPGYLNGLFETTIEGDMYNSLGSFYYSKTYADNGNVNIDIIDRYDWAYSKDGGSAQIFNDTLAKAQEIGVVTPFYTRINLTMKGYVPYDWEYTDIGVEITKAITNDTIAEIPKKILDLRIKPKEKVKQPEVNITSIGTNSFANKTSLTSVILPNSVTTIKDSAFNGCGSLSHISNLSNLTYIGDNVFKDCARLKSMDNLNNLEYIGQSAFENCVQLNDLSNLDSLEFIGMKAFYNCERLTNMLLSANVNYIGEQVFAKCDNLNLTIDKNNNKYCAQDNILYNKEKTNILGTCKIDSNVHILDSVTHITSYAFAESSNIENVYINNSIIIGTGAFANCGNLRAVYFYSTYLPKIDSYAFAYDDFIAYVPFISQNSYKTTLANYTDKIDSIRVQVEFNSKEKVIDTKNVYFGATIDNCILPTNEGESFEGWYDSNGVKYIDKNGKGVKLVDSKNKLVLYSHWSIKTYKIKIDANGEVTWLGPNGLSNYECDIEYGTIMSAINLIAEFKATKQGYKEGEIFDHFEYQNETINWTKIPDLGADGLVVEITPIWVKEIHTIYFKTSTDENINKIEKNYGTSITIPMPKHRTGFHFAGWYTNLEYTGEKVQWVTMPDLTPKNDNISYSKAQNNGSVQLFAKWIEIEYTIEYIGNGATEGSIQPSIHKYTVKQALTYNCFKRDNYDFAGWSLYENINKKKDFDNGEIVEGLTEESNIKLYAYWEPSVLEFHLWCFGDDGCELPDYSRTYKLVGDQTVKISPPDIKGYEFDYWSMVGIEGGHRNEKELRGQYDLTLTISSFYGVLGHISISLRGHYIKNNCVAEETMITLADGSQKAVEELTGNEMLLVWNMMTGKFDVAPILFIDKDAKTTYEVINLYFSDGTSVKVISEHAFWDFDLNKYVFLRNDADKYIGHWFNKQVVGADGNMTWTKVQLTNVEVKEEITTAYSPVTYSHLCYYVNGMLSMPGATEGLINIFEVDSETMKINEEAMQAEIEKYGLYTYEEFARLVPVTEEVFDAFNGQYLKVSIGKGLISIEQLNSLFNNYIDFLAK